jgi:hypothetical protein
MESVFLRPLYWTYTVAAAESCQALVWSINVMNKRWAGLGIVVFLIAIPASAQSLDGVWRTQGYGYVYDVRGDTWKTYEITATTCLPGFTATRSGGAAADRDATFTAEGSRSFFVRSGESAEHKVLHFDGAASDVRVDRLPRMPAICDRATPDTPQNNFEVFARTWAEHYISFDLKHTDWEKVVAANRPRVTTETRPAELFEILSGMIEPFGDAHTFVNASSIEKMFRGYRPGAERARPSALDVTDRVFVKGPLRKFCQDQLQYGHVDDTTGYLRILSFSGFSAKRGFAAGLEELEAALDTIFSDGRLEALIVDVRVNYGGTDPYGLAIASRLATAPYLAYSKVARADPVDRKQWTPADPNRVAPSARPGFRGPVVELIGPTTISAGETFTQALMGRTPLVTRIGENTQGVFSDVLSRRLPNGWTFGLPNEVFLTPAGVAFDGPGIPPDIRVAVFDPADLSAGRDPAMMKALEVLQRRERRRDERRQRHHE